MARSRTVQRARCPTTALADSPEYMLNLTPKALFNAGNCVADNKACEECGAICVVKEPKDCRFQVTVCTLAHPIGACEDVSSEGACAAYYSYGRHSTIEIHQKTPDPAWPISCRVKPFKRRKTMTHDLGRTCRTGTAAGCAPRHSWDMTHGSGGRRASSLS